MAHLHFCLECNTVVGESDENCEVDADHDFELCQTCSQHGAPAPEGAERAANEEP